MAAGPGLKKTPGPRGQQYLRHIFGRTPNMRGCGDCCRGVLLSLLVKNLILVWLVSGVLGSPSLKQAQANSLKSQAAWQ